MPGFVKQVTARNNRFALRISLLAALGGFLFGYDTGVVGGAGASRRREMHTNFRITTLDT